MMKKIYLFTVLLLMSTIVFGQQASGTTIRADIEKDKKAFITKELELSDSESEDFWSIYEKYETESKRLHTKQRKIKKALKNSDVLSADEQYKLTKQYLLLDKEKAEVRLKYLGLFSQKIGKKKAAAVFKAEDDFKRVLFKKIKKLPPPPPPPPGSNK